MDIALPAASEPEAASNSAPDAPSKSSLKKAAKAERIAAKKLERRAREKEAKKEKKRIKAEKRAAGQVDDEDQDKEKSRHKRRRLGPHERFGGRVVVDLGFDEMMSEKVILLLSGLVYTKSCIEGNKIALLAASLHV